MASPPIAAPAGGSVHVAKRAALLDGPPECHYLAQALDVVGDRWSLLIVGRLMFGGPHRYTDLQRGLGIATNLLASRLRKLEQLGAVRRVDFPPPFATRFFELTATGDRLRPVIVGLETWAQELLAPLAAGEVLPATNPPSA